MKRIISSAVALAAWVALAPAPATAQITISKVDVGDPGNPNDPATGRGSVAGAYAIGTYEVTLAQYAAFLNAVAKTDTYGLWNANMNADLNVRGISRSGSSGSYTYTVQGDGSRPVTYVSWFDAARFANWLHNGQPTGAQNASTTEQGAYTLNGAMTGVSITRNANAIWALPTENEWYKAAYYQPAGAGGDVDDYWLFPTRSNTMPNSRNGSASDPNSANFMFDDGIDNGYNGGYAVTQSPIYSSTQNYLTAAGAFSLASSYYGTYDQGGNVREWTEGVSLTSRIARGGAWNANSDNLRSLNRSVLQPYSEVESIGFRVVFIPEPSVGLIAVLGAGLLLWRRKANA
jgi:formylglycine-generating enzyme required for sulfatase activity